ncbi:MAG: hypothetical protein H6737_08570 [Alphaproteobacteria bacterium]|nr:hypothetical protein [Alphaproteobacteria bacterium]
MDYREVQHCYSLRDSKDLVRRGNALGRACEANYLDSCQLMYEHELAHGSPWMAFVAAETACRAGNGELCRIAIHFGERYPKYAEDLEERRPALEARLAELESSGVAP